MKCEGLHLGEAEPLSALTSLRLGGTPVGRVVVDGMSGLDALPEILKSLGGAPRVMGRGSNILARDGDLPITLVTLGCGFRAREPEVLDETGDSALVRVPAATPLPLFLKSLAARGYAGLEGLAGIPGQVGGAVAMNAGSFGQEIKDALEAVTLYAPDRGVVTLARSELDLGYRSFSAPALASSPWSLVLEASFRLKRSSEEAVRAALENRMDEKRRTQPVREASAGCVFRNHAAGQAGRLLEEAGMKGKAVGGMSFSRMHANFMVNSGDGRARDAFELIETAKEAVKASAGADLELEIKVWP